MLNYLDAARMFRCLHQSILANKSLSVGICSHSIVMAATFLHGSET